MESNSPPATAIIKHWPLLLLLVYFGLVFHGLIFATQGAFEKDGFFHARYCQQLPERGLSREFPWMQFAAWKDGFSDKDFLYHVLMAPFCRDAAEPLPGAKYFTLILLLGALIALYAVLNHYRVPWPLIWTALLAGGSALFLNRMLMVRSHGLSVLLMIVATPLLLNGRLKWVFAAGFLYSWCYSFPLALLITAVGIEAGRLIFHGFSITTLRVPLVAAAGIAAGLVLHPYTPHSLSTLLALLHISASGASRHELELGSEFQALRLRELFILLPPIALAYFAALGAGVSVWTRIIEKRKLSAESAGLLGAATAWFCALFVFSRLIEYFAPLAVLAFAFVFRDFFGASLKPWKEYHPSQRMRALSAVLVLVAIISLSHLWSVELVRRVTLSTQRSFSSVEAWQRGRYFDGAAKWLKYNVPAGSTLLNFHWDDFPELYYTAPEFHYIVGLDPTFMRLPYPQHSALLEAMRTEKTLLDFAKLAELFGAQYMLMRASRAIKYASLRTPQYAPVYADEGAVIYKLR